MQENIFIQSGQISFFSSPKMPSFLIEIKDSSRVGTTGFSTSRPGVRVFLVPNFFYDLSLTFFDELSY